MTADHDVRPSCFGTYGGFLGEPVRCSPAAGCGLKGCPWQRPQDGKPTDTVYAHVERTVHALLSDIERRIAAPEADDNRLYHVEHLAGAVQALSSWPQFNPMNAASDYQKLAEYEVQKAIKAYRDKTALAFAEPTCACGFGTQGRRLHVPSCPRVEENLEIPL